MERYIYTLPRLVTINANLHIFQYYTIFYILTKCFTNYEKAIPTLLFLHGRTWKPNSSFLFLYKNKFSLNAATAFFLKCTNNLSSYITVPCLDLSFFSKSESKFLEKLKIIFSGLFAIPYFCGTLQNLYNFYWTKLDFKVLILIPKKKSAVWKK